MRTLFLASTIAVLGVCSTAEAHFVLMAPTPSKPSDATGGKGPPPCGPDAIAATTPVPAMGGHTLHLDVKETTYHPGWYRIALGINGRADLPADPAVYDSKGAVLDPAKGGVNSASSDKQLPAKFPVLAADVWDHMAAPTMDFMMDLPIPNFDCPKCTLQIEEFMNQHPSNVGIGGFYYHHCADIKITADPTMPAFVPPGADGGTPDASSTDAKNDSTAAGTGGTTGSGGTPGAGTGGTGGGGTTGTAGSTGAAGASSGSGGTVGTTGGAGSSGAAGTGAAGVAGTAGTTGAGGAAPRQSSGGCALAATRAGDGFVATGILLLSLALVRRRRR